VDGTVVTVDYARPRARGRAKVFGGVVKWGEVWTPGANMATTLEASKDIELDGHALRKGKYSVWMVVREGDWTAVIDTDARRFHMNPPDTTKALLTFPLHREAGPRAEVLTWSFPAVSNTGMTLAFQWDTVFIPIRIGVPPSHPVTLDAAVAARYLGKFSLDWSSPGDGPPNSSIEFSYEGGSLRARWAPPLGDDPDYAQSLMIRLKDDWFIPGFLQRGELWEVTDDLVFEFTVEQGRATRFDLRSEDNLIGTGKRLP
jgi:hypothetical protein